MGAEAGEGDRMRGTIGCLRLHFVGTERRSLEVVYTAAVSLIFL